MLYECDFLLFQITEMITIVQTFSALSMSTIEGIDIMAIKFKNIYQSVQKKQYDILDPRKTEFDIDFVDFSTKIGGLEVGSIAISILTRAKFCHRYLFKTTWNSLRVFSGKGLYL